MHADLNNFVCFLTLIYFTFLLANSGKGHTLSFLSSSCIKENNIFSCTIKSPLSEVQNTEIRNMFIFCVWGISIFKIHIEML